MKQSKKKSGFSLLEFLVYLMLTVFVSILGVDFMTSSYAKAAQYAARCHESIALCAALDQLERDIQMFLSDESEWQLKTTDYYVWSGPTDIGWQVDNGLLIRSVGSYDSSRSAWTMCTKGVVACRVAHLLIDCVPGHGIRCVLRTEGGLIDERTVALRNRII